MSRHWFAYPVIGLSLLVLLMLQIANNLPSSDMNRENNGAPSDSSIKFRSPPLHYRDLNWDVAANQDSPKLFTNYTRQTDHDDKHESKLLTVESSLLIESTGTTIDLGDIDRNAEEVQTESEEPLADLGNLYTSADVDELLHPSSGIPRYLGADILYGGPPSADLLQEPVNFGADLYVETAR